MPARGGARLARGAVGGVAGGVAEGAAAGMALRAALGVALVGLAWPATSVAACPGPSLRFEALGPGLWWVPGQVGEADANNHGQVSNLVLAREGGHLWALGSGPSPAFGRALACQARQRLGLPITAVISPWARPELVLGVGGLSTPARASHWAHASVASAMAEQCPRCVQRLTQRLGAAAADLDDNPIHAPTHQLQGEHGRLGPFLWWRLPRAEGRWVTVWRARHQPLWVAHGLLNGGAPPDGRDADLRLLQQGTEHLLALAQPDGAAARFLGEQGPVMRVGDVVRQAAYWQGLLAAAAAGVERADDEAAPAPALPGLPAGWAVHAWHGFNWQRAWRQVEPEVLGAPVR